MSTWPEYLDALERYLAAADGELQPAGRGSAGEEGTAAGEDAAPERLALTAPPVAARPGGAVPAEHQGRALRLQAECSRLVAVGETRREELLGAQRRLELRLRAGEQGGRVDAVL